MRLKLRSLHARLLLTLSAGLIVVLALQATLAYRSTLRRLDGMFDLQMIQVAQAVAHGLSDTVPNGAESDDDEFDLRVERYRMPGTDDARFDLHRMDTTMVRGRRVRRVRIDNRGVRTEVTQDIDARQEAAADVALTSVSAPAGVGALLTLGLLALLSSLLRPLERLRRDVAARSADALVPLGETDWPTELEPVVTEMNRLLARMEQALEAQRNFVADAAHELRTPLAALVLQADVIEHAEDDGARHAALARLRAGLSRAARVAAQLLDLARADADAASSAPMREPIELLPLIGQMLDERSELVRAKSLHVAARGLASSLVLADRRDLRLVIANLLDNAIAHTPDHGQIELAWQDQGPAWRLTVDDSGPGIPDADRARVRLRFQRIEGTSQVGSGLGLSIVDQTLRRHGAGLALSTSRLGGLQAAVVWPRS